ncbi:MAG: hypothetical protein ACLFVQ_10240 [Chitinispirillaceae bacterium]
MMLKLRTIAVFISAVSVFLNCISVKSIPESSSYEEKAPLSDIVLDEEVAFIKAGARCAGTILLNTQVSFHHKTVRVYLENEDTYCLIFRFMGFYDHDAQLYDIEFRTSEENINLGKIDRNEHVVAGNLLDEHMIKQVDSAVFKKLAYADTLNGTIGEIEFSVPYTDRAGWRKLVSEPEI